MKMLLARVGALLCVAPLVVTGQPAHALTNGADMDVTVNFIGTASGPSLPPLVTGAATVEFCFSGSTLTDHGNTWTMRVTGLNGTDPVLIAPAPVVSRTLASTCFDIDKSPLAGTLVATLELDRSTELPSLALASASWVLDGPDAWTTKGNSCGSSPCP